jgi:hypothetical protein
MSSITTPLPAPGTTLHGDFKAAVSLAALLQRVDAQPQGIGPAQYQQLVLQLAQLLTSLPPGEGLQQLLHSFPAAAVVYENQQYGIAGLCRSPLEQSLASELQAQAAIAKARRRQP